MRVSREAVVQFYTSAVKSVPAFSVRVWFGILTKFLSSVYKFKLHQKALNIVTDDCHPAPPLFEEAPSGVRYKELCFKCERFKKTNIP